MNITTSRWLSAIECLRLTREKIDVLTVGADPCPWGAISSVGEPGDHMSRNVRPLAVSRRADLVVFRAFLRGSLVGHFVDGADRRRVPGWAWGMQGGDWRGLLFGSHFLPALLPGDWPRWSLGEIEVEKGEFELWLHTDEPSELGELPSLPPASDEADRPTPVTQQNPPNTPWVSLSHALSWLAFGISVDSGELNLALQTEAFGADDRATDKRFIDAVEVLCTAGTGDLRLIGKFVEAGHDATIALTEPIPPERLHDFKMFDVIRDGLRHGTGLRFTKTCDAMFSLALPISKRCYHEVKVERAGLLRLSAMLASAVQKARSAHSGGKVPPNRILDHDAIRRRAVELLADQPNLKIGPAAASIIAELGENPRTGKPWDPRGIERLIAPLWEGGRQ